VNLDWDYNHIEDVSDKTNLPWCCSLKPNSLVSQRSPFTADSSWLLVCSGLIISHKYRWHSFDKHTEAKLNLYVSSLWLTVSFEPKSLCLSSVRYRTLSLHYICTYFGKCQAFQGWNVRVIGWFTSAMCSERDQAHLKEWFKCTVLKVWKCPKGWSTDVRPQICDVLNWEFLPVGEHLFMKKKKNRPTIK